MRINKESRLIFLSGHIDDHDKVNELCEYLIYEKPSSCQLIINSTGGLTSCGIQIINAIKENPLVKIDCIVSGRALSLGAVIALSCASLKILPGSTIMLHGIIINFHEDESESIYIQQKYLNVLHEDQNYFDSLVKPFLTLEEIERINSGDEIYVSWNDPTLSDRINRHFNKEAL